MPPGPDVARHTPEPAGRLGVAGRHERGRLLVVHEHEPNAVLVTAQRLRDPVDPVAGQAEDGVDAPVGQPLDQQLRRDLHGVVLVMGVFFPVSATASHAASQFDDNPGLAAPTR